MQPKAVEGEFRVMTNEYIYMIYLIRSPSFEGLSFFKSCWSIQLWTIVTFSRTLPSHILTTQTHKKQKSVNDGGEIIVSFCQAQHRGMFCLTNMPIMLSRKRNLDSTLHLAITRVWAGRTTDVVKQECFWKLCDRTHDGKYCGASTTTTTSRLYIWCSQYKQCENVAFEYIQQTSKQGQ